MPNSNVRLTSTSTQSLEHGVEPPAPSAPPEDDGSPPVPSPPAPSPPLPPAARPPVALPPSPAPPRPSVCPPEPRGSCIPPVPWISTMSPSSSAFSWPKSRPEYPHAATSTLGNAIKANGERQTGRMVALPNCHSAGPPSTESPGGMAGLWASGIGFLGASARVSYPRLHRERTRRSVPCSCERSRGARRGVHWGRRRDRAASMMLPPTHSGSAGNKELTP